MQAAAPVFVDKDDQSNRWLNDITAKNLLVPKSLADVEGKCLLVAILESSISEPLCGF